MYQTQGYGYGYDRGGYGADPYGMNDYETNRKKSGGVALLGLAWCIVWIYVFGTELAYIN